MKKDTAERALRLAFLESHMKHDPCIKGTFSSQEPFLEGHRTASRGGQLSSRHLLGVNSLLGGILVSSSRSLMPTV